MKTEVSVKSGGGATLIFLLFLSVLAGGYFFYKYSQGKKEIIDLKATKTALLRDSVGYYKAKNENLVAVVEKISLEKEEIDLYSKKIRSDLKNMRIKLRDAELYISTNTSTYIKPPDIPLRDTIYIDKDKPIIGKSFSWSDNYGGMGGIVTETEVKSPYYYTKDTLIAVGEKVYKYKFLGLRFKVIGARLKVTNANPHSTITSPEYLNLK